MLNFPATSLKLGNKLRLTGISKEVIFLLTSKVSIKIILHKRRLYLYRRAQLYNSYPIAIGKPSTPSPIGTWKIINKKIMDGRQVFGTRWMGLSKPHYGIHGTNNPSSIGKAVSLGCIRMYNRDIEIIFPLVSLGTIVYII
ncbi:MAG TPA: L,D-transpeptidase [Clostridia bacterium]|nr:L,D-transpeptidase [Clostridia bacterium]